MEAQHDSDGQSDPEHSQPRMFGGYVGSGKLPWSWARERLTGARNYWIATTRPDGNPHSRPVWGVWYNDVFYFSTGSLAARNVVTRPAITVHLESGNEVVIIEGLAEQVSDTALIEQVVHVYNQKYNWNLDPHNMQDPFYAVRPHVAFGWHLDEAELNPQSTGLGTATRWKFK